MIGFANLVARFAPTPSTAVIAEASGQSLLTLALTRNWKAAMSLISEKLDTAHAKRTELVEARRALLLAAVEGDDGANAKLRKVENDLADHDRHIARLQDARGLAAERDDAEKAAEAIAEQKRLRAAWDAECEDTIQLADSVDALGRKYAVALSELLQRTEKIAAACPVELAGGPADRPLGHGRTEAAAQMELAHAGLAWAWRGLLPWRDRPTVASTVREGVDWARNVLQRKSPLKTE